jgi:hypothetical protein
MDAERSPRHPSEFSFRMKSKRRMARHSRHWLLLAAGLCWLSWPTPAEAQPACAHGLCEQGGGLNPVCDPCVDAICNGPGELGDPYCCDVEWDDNCVDLVLPLCGDPSCVQVCSHNPCEIGEALDSTCNSCTALVCFNHPECCTDDGDPLTDDWDAVCVSYVQQECLYQCDPGADICSQALPINAGRIFGTLLGSSNDGCASSENGPSGVSCRSGDVWYTYTQGALGQDMTISTCATQRSFGIDTVVSVHTGCPGRTNNELVANDDYALGDSPLACILDANPKNLDAAVPLEGVFALEPGETVVIRVAHHDDSVRENFDLKVLPEPEVWLALVAGAGALQGAKSQP